MLSGAGERTMGGGYHGGLLSIDMFAQVSNLRAVNPLIKFIFAISVLLATLWADSPLTSIVVVVMITIALVPVARIPMGYLFVLMKMPLLFIVISCITIAVNFTTQPFGFANLAFAGGYLSITAFSLQKAAALALKAYAAVSCLYFLSLTTPMPEIVDILRKLHIPAIVIELMYLIYRYIFVLF
ncbi:MAG: CbiQ family ECF transporter T component, partial [Clostridiales bacterium]